MADIKPKQLSPEIVNLLSLRLQDEQKASMFYNLASNWCALKGYEGGKKYFAKEAMEEQEHYQELASYITGMNSMPSPLPVSVNETFEDLCDIIEKAYEIELTLLEAYNAVSKQCIMDDLTTFEYLKKFRDIQRESVIRYSDLVNQLEILDDEKKFDVFYFDREVLSKLA